MKIHAPSDSPHESRNNNAQPRDVMTKAELADYLRISTRTVDEWMRDGRIPFWKISRTVRFRRRDVDQHLELEERRETYAVVGIKISHYPQPTCNTPIIVTPEILSAVCYDDRLIQHFFHPLF